MIKRSKKIMFSITFYLLIIGCFENNHQKVFLKDKENAVSVFTISDTPQLDEKVRNIMRDSFDYPCNSLGVLSFSVDSIGENNFNNDTLITIKNEDNTVFCEYSVNSFQFKIGDFSIQTGMVASNKDTIMKLGFNPYCFIPEYGLFMFEYLSIDEHQIQVIIDNNKKKTKYFDFNYRYFTVESWEEHLIGKMFTFDVQKNPIHQKPNETSSILESEDDGFIIQEVKGEWVKIVCADICGEKCEKPFEGWIRWKKGNRRIIRLDYIC